MGKWIEWMLGHNECCSVPSPNFLLVTYVKEILLKSTNTDAGEMITPA